MKVNCLAAAAAALMAAASGAQANLISIHFDSPAVNATPGQTVSFAGSISNLAQGTVDLNSVSINIAGILVADSSPFLLNAPLSLDLGAVTASFEMFTVDVPIPYTGSFGLQSGSFTILGGLEGPKGYDPDAQEILGSATFDINVQDSALPEPGTLALAMTGLGFAIVARRSMRTGGGRVDAVRIRSSRE